MGPIPHTLDAAAIDIGQSRLQKIVNMSAKKRSKYLVTGGLCAALTMLIPDMYEIDYRGPALPKGVNLHGVTGGFSALTGPYDGGPMLASFVFLFLVGLLTRFMDFSTAWSRLSRGAKYLHGAHHATAVGANFFGLWSFYRQFDNGGIPTVVTDAFVARVGGGAQAKADTAFLYPSFGLTAVLLVLAVGWGLIGVMPLFFCIIDGLAMLLIVVTVGAGVLGVSLPWSPGMVNVATYDGRRPTPSDACVLAPGHDENCASVNPEAAVQLPDPAADTTDCTYTITVDWGDHSPVRTVKVKGGKDSVLFRADHVYKGVVGAWLLHVTEKASAGRCAVGPARWTPEFALGEKVGDV
jgi:hypothetical protein